MGTEWKKYPRTPHLPWSGTISDDDKKLDSVKSFIGREVIVTEKLDGECLDGDTKVLTSSGEMTISDICESGYLGEVLSFNTVTNQIEMKNVTGHQVKDEADDWYELELEDGRVLKITGAHMVWLVNENRYCKVSDLKGGEDFLVI